MGVVWQPQITGTHPGGCLRKPKPATPYQCTVTSSWPLLAEEVKMHMFKSRKYSVLFSSPRIKTHRKHEMNKIKMGHKLQHTHTKKTQQQSLKVLFFQPSVRGLLYTKTHAVKSHGISFKSSVLVEFQLMSSEYIIVLLPEFAN